MKHIYSGKVRDIYDTDDDHLLLVASDRMSAFDVVMAEPIPDKGRVLTAMSAFWFDQMTDLAPSHLVTADVAHLMPEAAGRGMLVRRAEMINIECIVRGYLSGSALKEYKATGTMHGTKLPPGMQESDQLPEPVFTPSKKAATGHDENISFEHASEIVGDDVAKRAREMSLAIYERGAAMARAKGVIIADTKFEFGFIDGELSLCDEVLTPDSSRFWPADEWQPGRTPPSFDKQPLRDWLESTGWNKEPPPPALPDDVVAATRERYVAAYERVTGLSLNAWFGA